jgi:putative peptidoglycan lipid II flippase
MKRFLVYAFAPLIYNLSIIIATVGFSDRLGVHAVVWGVIIGAFLHMLIQLLTVRGLGIRIIPTLNFHHPALKKIVSMMWPRSIALGSMQLMLLIFTAIASSLGAGSVAIYSFADNIQTMPTAVFAFSFTTALFPTIAEAATKRNFDELALLVWRGLRYLTVIMVPSGVGLLLVRTQIIRLILGTGHFDWQATVATANTLGLFALSLIAQSIVVHLSRTFYAMHDTRTPTLFNVIGYVASIASAYWLAPATGLNLGVPGLALAFTIGSFLNAILLYATMRLRLKQIRAFEIGAEQLFGQVLLGCVALFLAVQAAKTGIAWFVDMDRFWGVLVQTVGAIVAGSGAYWLVLRAFKVAELSELYIVLASRLKIKLPQASAVSSVDVGERGIE